VTAMPPNFGTSTTPDTTRALYPNQPVPGGRPKRKPRPKARPKAKGKGKRG
jgi:hypothetical protein